MLKVFGCIALAVACIGCLDEAEDSNTVNVVVGSDGTEDGCSATRHGLVSCSALSPTCKLTCDADNPSAPCLCERPGMAQMWCGMW